jgi:PAS domain S-box-containing protein
VGNVPPTPRTRHNSQRYESLVGAYSDFVWICDAEGRLVEDIPWWRTFTRQPVEALLGHGWLDAVHPDDRAGVEAAWDESVQTGGLFDVEYRIVDPEGSVRSLEVRGAPVRGPEGEIAEWIGICRDVTARREAEAQQQALQDALDAERETLARVVDQAPMAVAVLSGPEHAFRFFNRAYLDLMAPPGRVRAGTTVREAFPELGPAVLAMLDRAYGGEELRLSDYPVPFEDEHSFEGNRYYEFHYSPITEGGEPAGVLAVATETTEEVRLRSDLQRRVHEERVLAEQLQRLVMPEVVPAIAGVELALSYAPATANVGVGGDWYDALALPGGDVLLVIGDVAGRGIDAATAMAQLRNAVRAYALDGHGPAEILARVARYSDHLELTDLATVGIGRLDPRTGTLTYASAGHLPPLVVRPDGEPELLWDVRGPVIGVDGERPEIQATLAPGSTLVLYTDGLVEERERSLDVTLEELRRAAAGRVSSAAALRDRLAARPAGGEPSQDDVALLVCRIPAAATRGRPDYYGNPAGLTADVDVVRAIYAAFEARDVDAVLAHLASDCEMHFDGTARLIGRTGPYRGHEGLRQYLADVENVWGELSLHADDYRVVPGSVIVLGSVSGMRDGQPVSRAAVWTWRLRDGRVAFMRASDMGDLVRP